MMKGENIHHKYVAGIGMGWAVTGWNAFRTLYTKKAFQSNAVIRKLDDITIHVTEAQSEMGVLSLDFVLMQQVPHKNSI